MRSKRTREPSSIGRDKFVPNGRESRDKATLLPSERAFGANRDLFLIQGDDVRPTSSLRLTEDIAEHKHAERGIKIVSTTLLAGLAALAALLVLGALELVLERVLSDAVALSVPVIFGSITAAGITYFALRRQEAFHRRTLEERERAENARREAERKYREIVENAVEGIFQTSPDGGFITANPALARMLGFETPEELIRAREREGTYYVHPERRIELRRLLDQHDTVRGFEFEAYRKDGTKIWMSDNVRAVRDASGKLLYYEGTTEDITGRKLAKDARREAERKYRDIFENAVEGIFQTSPDGEFIAANPALACMLGFETPEELIRERTDIERTHYVEPERRAEFRRLLDRHDTVRGFEFEAYRKDGTKIWMSDNVSAVRDASGKLLYYEGTTEDITGRKLAKDARREAERKYRDIFENAVEGIFQTSPDGEFIAANPALARMLGFESPEELIRERTDIGRTHYVESERRAEFKRLLDQHDTVRGFEFEAYRKDGTKIWMSDNVRAVRDASGKLLYYEGTVEDITERKLAEEALRESEERYRDLVENSRDLICTHDLDGLVLSANPAAAAAVGYDLDEFVGKKTIRDLLVPEVRDQFDQYMARLRKEGTTSGIMLVQTRSGERRMWEYYNSLRTEGVAIPIVRGMARDITEQRRAEAALRDSEERYRELFENDKDAIYVHDLNGVYRSVNRAAERLSGYSREEILGKHFRDFVSPEYLERVGETFGKKLEGTGETTYEIEIIRRDGARVPVEVSSRLIYENGVAIGVQGSA